MGQEWAGFTCFPVVERVESLFEGVQLYRSFGFFLDMRICLLWVRALG